MRDGSECKTHHLVSGPSRLFIAANCAAMRYLHLLPEFLVRRGVKAVKKVVRAAARVGFAAVAGGVRQAVEPADGRVPTYASFPELV